MFCVIFRIDSLGDINMGILFELGISDNDIKSMLELCPELINIGDDDIKKKIDILSFIGCNIRHIRNILISNPYYLDRIDNDILKLINYLKYIGVSNIYLLFDSNPYLLNKDMFEIEEYINSKIKLGLSISEIVDEFESNPYIIDEI